MSMTIYTYYVSPFPSVILTLLAVFFFFFNDTATTEIYTLSLHDALPIYALGLALTDFYLGLAAFHLGVGLTTSLCARRWRWLGVALIALALVLGALT